MHEMVHCLVAKTVTNVLSGNSRSSCMVFFFSPALVPHSFSRACFRLSCCINTVMVRLVWPASMLPTYSLFMLQYMKACEGVFAAGDIAHFPLKGKGDYWSLADFAQAWYVFMGDIVEMVQ